MEVNDQEGYCIEMARVLQGCELGSNGSPRAREGRSSHSSRPVVPEYFLQPLCIWNQKWCAVKT